MEETLYSEGTGYWLLATRSRMNWGASVAKKAEVLPRQTHAKPTLCMRSMGWHHKPLLSAGRSCIYEESCSQRWPVPATCLRDDEAGDAFTKCGRAGRLQPWKSHLDSFSVILAGMTIDGWKR